MEQAENTILCIIRTLQDLPCFLCESRSFEVLLAVILFHPRWAPLKSNYIIYLLFIERCAGMQLVYNIEERRREAITYLIVDGSLQNHSNQILPQWLLNVLDITSLHQSIF